MQEKGYLLNSNDMDGTKIDSLDVELMTYYIIAQSAMDTSKYEYLRKLEDAMIKT